MGMQIVLRRMFGPFYTIRVRPTDTIAAIKQQLLHKKGLPKRLHGRLEEGQTLFLNGVELRDETTLRDNGITDMCTVHVIYGKYLAK